MAIQRLDALAAAISQIARLAAEVYANGSTGRGRPIVWKHFTAGNSGRYQWAPLTQSYAARKAGQAGKLRSAMKKRGAVVAKMDKSVPFQSRTGTLMGQGSGVNLPMLVRSGDLRDAVVSPTLHRIAVSGDAAMITFTGLPKYAAVHHGGLGHMPRRSPVEPNQADKAEIVAHLQRTFKGLMGQTGKVPVSGGTIPGSPRGPAT